jgi:hypothetical protein
MFDQLFHYPRVLAVSIPENPFDYPSVGGAGIAEI